MKGYSLCMALLLCLGQASLCFGQTLESILEHFHAPLDRSEVQSGILIDQTPVLLWPSKYDGSRLDDSLQLNLDQFGMLYGQFRGGAVGPSVLPDPTIFLSQRDADTVMLTALLMQYDFIHRRIDSLQLLEWIDGQLHDVPGRPISPYATDTTFAFVSLQSTFAGLDVPFVFPASLFFSNISTTPDSVSVDFADGRGWRILDFDEAVIINYPFSGEKAIQVKVWQGDNAYLFQTSIRVEESLGDSRNNVPYDKSDPEVIELTGMDLSIFSACVDKKLRQPLIVVEGFGGVDDSDKMFQLLEEDISEGSLKDYLNTAEYDLIWVDYKFPFASVETNADFLIEAIEWINARKHADGSHAPNVMIGASMGGLVGKLGLLKMHNELARQSEVERFFTYDSPLQGANYPIGIQAFIRDLVYQASNVGASVASFQDALNLLDSPAAEDMLRNRVQLDLPTPSCQGCPVSFSLAPEPFIYDRIEALESQQSLSSITRHLAIVNGAGNGTLQESLTDEAFPIMEFILYLGEVENQDGPQICYNVIMSAVAYHASSNNTLIYDRNISIQIHPICEFISGIESSNSPASFTLPTPVSFDDVPASTSNLGFFALENGLESIIQSLDHVVFSYAEVFIDGFAFIPTVSALDAPPGTSPGAGMPVGGSAVARWSASLDNSVISPYSGVVEFNQDHVSMNTRIADFIAKELIPGTLVPLAPPLLDGNIYHFGRSGPVNNMVLASETPRTIDNDLTLQNGAELWINREGRLGYSDSGNPLNAHPQQFRVMVPDVNCTDDTEAVTVTVEAGSSIRLGAYQNGVHNTGHLHFGNNSALVVNGSSGVMIDAYSHLQIGPESQMTINNGGEVLGPDRARLSIVQNSLATVENGGRLELGIDAIGRVESGSTLRIKNGGKLRLTEGATLTIEPGAKLIIEPGAEIDLWWGDSYIEVQGELVYRGTFDFSGSGYFLLENTHTLTMEASALEITGQAGDHFLRLGEKTVLDVGSHNLILKDGGVEYSSNASIKATAGARVELENMRLTGLGDVYDEHIGLDIEGVEELRLFGVEVERLGIGIWLRDALSTTPTRIYFTDFTDCLYGLLATRANVMDLQDITFNSSAPFAFAFYAEDIDWLGMGRVTIEQYQAIGGESAFKLKEVSIASFSGVTLKNNGIGVELRDVPELRIFGGSIENNGIGIQVPQTGEADGKNESNILLFRKAVVSNNTTGIQIDRGGENPDGSLYGMVLMDCAELSNNGKGITGTDVTLQIDAYLNAGTNDPALIRPNQIYGGGTYFDICYDQLAPSVSTVLARGNYWGGGEPSFLRYKVNTPATDCATFGGILNTSLPVDVFTDCDDDELAEPYPDGGGVIVISDENPDGFTEDECELIYSGSTPTAVHEVWFDAWHLYRAGQTGIAKAQFASLAAINALTHQQASASCQHYIKVAKALTHGTAALQSEQATSQKESTLRLIPNPAKDGFIITSSTIGQGMIKVYNATGQLMHEQTYKSGTWVSTTAWESGWYILRLYSPETGTQEIQRLILQH